jgi:hypothetical protein
LLQTLRFAPGDQDTDSKPDANAGRCYHAGGAYRFEVGGASTPNGLLSRRPDGSRPARLCAREWMKAQGYVYQQKNRCWCKDWPVVAELRPAVALLSELASRLQLGFTVDATDLGNAGADLKDSALSAEQIRADEGPIRLPLREGCAQRQTPSPLLAAVPAAATPAAALVLLAEEARPVGAAARGRDARSERSPGPYMMEGAMWTMGVATSLSAGVRICSRQQRLCEARESRHGTTNSDDTVESYSAAPGRLESARVAAEEEAARPAAVAEAARLAAGEEATWLLAKEEVAKVAVEATVTEAAAEETSLEETGHAPPLEYARYAWG